IVVSAMGNPAEIIALRSPAATRTELLVKRKAQDAILSVADARPHLTGGGYLDQSGGTAARHIQPLTPEERVRAENLVARGQRYLRSRNLQVARHFFQRAAVLGLERGALLLAATYDRRELSNLGVLGVQPDSVLAQKWYERARALGARGA